MSTPGNAWIVSLVLFLAGVPSPAGADDLLISEFLAINRGDLRDQDGDTSDWLEVHNPGVTPIHLGGWYLTDDEFNLQKFELPPVTIQPGAFLLIFASGKDRAPPGGEIHTNFQLSGIGEYLALVRPDGFTVAHDYAPAYPPQRPGISFGVGQAVETRPLVPPAADLRVQVPNGSDGQSWAGGSEPFDDSTWMTGRSGVGYVTSVSGFAVRNYLASVQVGSLATAEQVIGDATLQNEVFAENVEVIDYLGTNGGGHYDGNRRFPGSSPGENVDNFVVEATAVVTIPSAGSWTFGVRSDDGFGLDLDNGLDSFRVDYPGVRGPGDTLGTFNIPAPGDYDLRLVFYERGGGSEVELFAARGSFGTWSSTNFRLVGDTARGGLAVRSEVVSSGASLDFRSLIRTDVEAALFNRSASAYVRIPFVVGDPLSYESLTLRARYDDGFVAYLNGVEVARRNAPELLQHDSRATVDRSVRLALELEDIDISPHLGLLRAGDNLLAAHGLNNSTDSPDFLVDLELAEVRIQSMVPGYFDRPSPGASNPAGFVDIVADTKFNPDRGFYASPFSVTITTATRGADIYYTTDGSPPSPTRGTLYNGPIPVAGTTVLRAAAFRAGFIPTNVDTHTYIFLDDVIRQDVQATLDAGFPPSWGSTSPDYGMDPDVIGPRDRYGGKYRATIKDDLLAVPTLSIVLRTTDMFGSNGIYTNSTRRGRAWERPTSAELIHPDGTRGFQVDCGIRIQGGAFRGHGLTKKHSLRLLFKGIYGPTKLRYPLFGDDGADEFDTVTLRANSNDGWQWAAAGSKPLFIRDSFGRQLTLDMGGVASHETFVHVYINGIYWGLYNPVERPDGSFAATYFGGDKDTWDAISNGSASDGNMNAWNTLLNLASGGLASDAAYQRIQGNHPDGTDDPSRPSYLDVENVVDYMITNLWVGNTDWPHKNYWIARNRVDSTGFKFFMWDSEWSMGLRSSLNTNQTGVDRGVAAPYAAARANEEFRMLFADRVHRYFFNGGPLYVDPASPRWDPAHPERNVPAARFMRLADQVDRAVVAESARWGDQHNATPYTRDEHWQVERDNLLRNYLPRRSSVVLQQFRGARLYPNVAAPVFNQHGGEIPEGFPLVITAPGGVIYYTLDGSDPRLPGGGVSPSARIAGSVQSMVLVTAGASARFHVPASGSLGLAWTAVDFNDASWARGSTGIGYERSSGYEALIGTDVESLMYNQSSSVYLRVPFSVSDPGAIALLTLRMKYDDGYVAYLNGTPVAARNAPGSPVWNSSASSSRDDAEAAVFESIDLSESTHLLRPSANVLAIHGLNSGTTSSDMLILPELVASDASGSSVILDRTTRVRSRALSGGEWSAINEATFVAGLPPLRVTEIMYHPPTPSEGSPFTASDFEFVEVKNVGDEPVDLAGIRFTAGIRFDFSTAPLASLLPGEVMVVVHNLAAFSSQNDTTAMNIAGEYSARLSNGGETLVLTGALEETIQEFLYEDTWYPVTDGEGFSLVIVDEQGSAERWSQRAGWRASDLPGGSPGTSEGGGPPPGGFQLPGDSNQDGILDISDAISLLLRLFNDGGQRAPCDGINLASGGHLELLDSNGDARVDLSDSIYLLAHLFRGGPPPTRGTRCLRIEGCPNVCFQ